jgi:hypothetical protein
MSILIVLASDMGTSTDDWVNRLNSFAGAYYLFKDHGVELALASPSGGWPWPGLGPHSSELTGSFARLAQDLAAREELADTLSLAQVCVDDFEGAYCVGLVGPIWRSAQEGSAEGMLAQFLAVGKPVAVIPSILDLSPYGSGKGLLITGEAAEAALLAAHALFAATQAMTANQRRRM